MNELTVLVHLNSMSLLLRQSLAFLALTFGYQTIAQAGTITGVVATDTYKFSPSSTASEISASGAFSMTYGETTIYVGTHQASSTNQNAIIASVTGDTVNWIKADYENLAPDSDARGVVWDGLNLYVVLTADGGAPLGDGGLERFTQDGWLSSYGAGGGANASVILKLDPSSGDAEFGTFVYAKRSSGDTNTIMPTALSLVDDQLIFNGLSFFSPLRTDRTTMECEGSSPFEYRAIFAGDLSTAISSEALRCDSLTAFTDLGEIIDVPDTGTGGDTETGGDTDTGNETGSDDNGTGMGEDSDSDPDDVGEDSETQPVPEPSVGFALASIAIALRRMQQRRQA